MAELYQCKNTGKALGRGFGAKTFVGYGRARIIDRSKSLCTW